MITLKKEHTQKDYSEEYAGTYYLDGNPLRRPSKLPPLALVVGISAIVFAGIISFFCISKAHEVVIDEPLQEKQATEEAFSKSVDMSCPYIVDMLYLSNEQLDKLFSNLGYTIYDQTDETDLENDGITYTKVPDGLTLEECKDIYETGFSKSKSSKVATLINGSWTLYLTRSGYINVAFKYADFTSESAEEAISNALKAQGISEETILESGEDTAGNTYTSGSIHIDKNTTYTWRVSVINLDEVYNINFMPENAWFVGIRMTAPLPTEDEEDEEE